MKIETIRFKLDGEDHELAHDVKPIDIVRFERAFKVSAEVLEQAPRFEHGCFIIWAILTRTQVITEPYADAFIERLDGIEMEVLTDAVEEAEPDPQPAGDAAE